MDRLAATIWNIFIWGGIVYLILNYNWSYWTFIIAILMTDTCKEKTSNEHN